MSLSKYGLGTVRKNGCKVFIPVKSQCHLKHILHVLLGMFTPELSLEKNLFKSSRCASPIQQFLCELRGIRD